MNTFEQEFDKQSPVIKGLAAWLFGNRMVVLAMLAVVTVFFGWQASQIRIDAGFEKQLPIGHPYMETFRKHADEFGGANRVLVAVRATDGDIFQPQVLKALEDVTGSVMGVSGVDQSRVSSLFTPNVRFIEVVEGGFAGGNVISSTFQPLTATPEEFDRIRENVLKSGQVGRLVASDFTAALVSAQLVEIDPATGEPLDYLQVAEELEKIREQYRVVDADGNVTSAVDIHIIGFAKAVGDIADGAKGVLLFFGVAVVISLLLVWAYAHSFRLAVLPVICSIIAVVWQLGILNALGFGIDPMSILVPFLVFAIGVSHGVQLMNGTGAEIYRGRTCKQSVMLSFSRLLVPGLVAVGSDTAGFLTLLLIPIPIIQELAITAALGVAVIVVTNLIMMPLLISFLNIGEKYRDRVRKSAGAKQKFWYALSAVAAPKPAAVALISAVALFGFGWVQSEKLQIGDLQAGVPELRADSRYNQDTAVIVDRFEIGVDIINVLAEVPPDTCVNGQVMGWLDRFEWHMANVPGVQSTLSLPNVVQVIHAGWNEGNIKWRVLPTNKFTFVEVTRNVPTSTGLLNIDCSVMPIMVFTEDHKAETIARVVQEVKDWREANPAPQVDGAEAQPALKLATGNVGVMAATNETVKAAQIPMLYWVYGVIVVLCLLSFRSLRATICTVLPLTLVSVLCYALMPALDIGLKISTLPVAALGVGIGVDYGIYIFSRLRQYLREGEPLRAAYFHTLQETGSAVILTGLTLAIGVSTWIFSALKFQADMGILLTFMFVVNMLGAILLLPALACIFWPKQAKMEWDGK
ncbi:MAG: MMPL family transporter [Alphaproteobacteria bacterium]